MNIYNTHLKQPPKKSYVSFNFSWLTGITVNAVNTTLTALKFFFQITLDKPEVVTRVRPVTVARKLPVVLSVEEAKRFMAVTSHPKFKAALAVAYGAGLRVSEVISLKVSDIGQEGACLTICTPVTY